MSEGNRKSLEPQLLVKDKVVQVGSLSWADFRKLVDAFSSANLPLPTLDGEGLRQKIDALQATAAIDGSVVATDLIGLVVEFVSSNLPTIVAWIAQHPPLVETLVLGATNLTAEETAALSAGQMLRVARAAFRCLVDDGVFAEAAGFFGELLGLKPATTPPVKSTSLGKHEVDDTATSAAD